MEEQINAILGNPEMMEKLQALAGSFSQAEPSPAANTEPSLDIAAISAMLTKCKPDNRQQKLLDAMACYLSREKVEKLRKAMRAARLAGMASGFLNGR